MGFGSLQDETCCREGTGKVGLGQFHRSKLGQPGTERVYAASVSASLSQLLFALLLFYREPAVCIAPVIKFCFRSYLSAWQSDSD